MSAVDNLFSSILRLSGEPSQALDAFERPPRRREPEVTIEAGIEAVRACLLTGFDPVLCPGCGDPVDGECAECGPAIGRCVSCSAPVTASDLRAAHDTVDRGLSSKPRADWPVVCEGCSHLLEDLDPDSTFPRGPCHIR